ncbi:MAG: isoaspartyl peptidase/L-asparaginase [Chloroflexi bacterium]|nr:isoaspartyl peptidase/L-asparaginase [Chloroflexota bacterium]
MGSLGIKPLGSYRINLNSNNLISREEAIVANLAIVVHGGAGAWDVESERMQVGLAACRAAALAGHAVLKAGGSALDAVETAVHILEDCPALDAGRGSYLNTNGEIEMDALIMDGRSLNMGAVAAIQRVRHPISLARRVMTDTEHAFLVGPGADTFADQIGFPRCATEDLTVPPEANGSAPAKPLAGPLGDTVGAVAFDIHGDLAAATSTGGTRNKMPGRVGDSPLVGSGGYADNWTAAVSATGQGEAIMKVVLSKRVCDLVSDGLSAQAACEAAIRLLEERVGGECGLIAIDAQGQVGVARNTRAMPYAFVMGEDEGGMVDGR